MWNEVLAAILLNLQKISIGLGILILMYLSNVSAGIWYNVKVLNEQFEWKKLTDSAIKVLCLGLAIACLVVGFTLVIPWVSFVGLELPQAFTDVLNIVAMCGVALTGIVKYGVEAFSKIKSILTDEDKKD